MAKYIINGGNRLEGAVTISGAKNAAVVYYIGENEHYKE